MDSVWFSVDEDSDYESIEDSLPDGSSPFMGVFNQRPEEIARWLPRPQTPFVTPTKFQPVFPSKFQTESISIQRHISQPDSCTGFPSRAGASLSVVPVF